jgi:hypothetical protein
VWRTQQQQQQLNNNDDEDDDDDDDDVVVIGVAVVVAAAAVAVAVVVVVVDVVVARQQSFSATCLQTVWRIGRYAFTRLCQASVLVHISKRSILQSYIQFFKDAATREKARTSSWFALFQVWRSVRQ